MNEQAAALLSHLQRHLQAVKHSPSQPLDEKAIDAATYALAPTLSSRDRQDLVLQIYQLLPDLQQDPTLVVRLLSKLLDPVPLSHILSLDPPPDLVAGLQVTVKPFNDLTLSLLEKAERISAQNLASTQPQLFTALVELWLSTEDEGVADKAGQVLVHLLRVDLPDGSTVGFDGPVWRRLLRDSNVYERMFAITDTNTGKDKTLNKNRKTIAQARLLSWLPVVGKLDWAAISSSYHPGIESAYGLPEGRQSLLDYAFTHMVDYKHDVLMHRTLMASFESLLKINPASSQRESPALAFLVKAGLHKRTLDYYISPDDPSHDPLDLSFLYAPSANYVATWAETYPEDFSSPTNLQLEDKILKKIHAAMNVSAARWAHAHAPVEDLHVLASLPRPTLGALGHRNPVLLIPSRAANTDALRCLAAIFHGPLIQVTFPATAPKSTDSDEVKAAQTIYTQYLQANDRLWSDIVTHADTTALMDQALAAINLIKAVLTAQWDGLSAIMEGPGKASVVPWLLSQPKMYSNLVGGKGDAENAAYKIALAKFDVLKKFFDRIKIHDEYRDVGKIAEQKIREGPWGNGQEIGGRIGTMDL